MRNLVLGSSGFLGKRLCDFLRERGEDVIEFDIKNDGKEQDARTATLPLDNVDRVYFLAWDVGGAKYLYKKDAQIFQMEWNSKLMNNVFPQIMNIPFVFVSSQLSEKVDSVYGSQKRLGEVWTKLSKNGISVRLWNLYGYNEPFNERSHVMSDFIYQAINNNRINMLTKGEEHRQFVHIDDVCEGLLKSFEVNDKSKTYDLSSKKWTSLLDVVKIIKKETNCSVLTGEKSGETVFIENKELVPGWKSKISLEQGIKRMIKELKDEC